MIHPDTELRHIDDTVGYGVFATRFIPRGTLTWTLCHLDRVLRRSEVAGLPAQYRPVLDHYGYLDARGRTVLCWDFARYLNHSCEAASLGVGPGAEIAVRDIRAGDQLTTEYGTLNLAEPLQCLCDAPTCRGVIRAEDALRYAEEWDNLAADALAIAGTVDQPLAPFHRSPDELAALLRGGVAPRSHRDFYFAGRSGDGGAPTRGGASAA